MSIQENYAKNKGIVIESWNPYKKEELTIEATEKMRKEIARQKEIINNATKIFEGKNVSTTIAEDCCIDKECAASQKNNIKKTSDGKGEPTGNGGDPFTKSSSAETSKTQKTNVKKEFKPVMNEEETLAWNDNKDYLIINIESSQASCFSNPRRFAVVAAKLERPQSPSRKASLPPETLS
jgi:hypothetical protein